MTEDAQAEAEQVIYDYECGAVEHNELVAALAAAIEVQEADAKSSRPYGEDEIEQMLNDGLEFGNAVTLMCEALSALRWDVSGTASPSEP